MSPPACSITEIVRISIEATAEDINHLHRPLSFELLGYDFMVDEDFKKFEKYVFASSNYC